MREHIEDRRDNLEGMEGDIRRLENMLLVEMGDCKKSGDGLEKRLSKLEDVSGRLDGVFDSIIKLKEGRVGMDLAYHQKSFPLQPAHSLYSPLC